MMGEGTSPYGKQSKAMAFANKLTSPVGRQEKRKTSVKKDINDQSRPFEKWPTVQVLIQKARELKKESGSDDIDIHASSTQGTALE